MTPTLGTSVPTFNASRKLHQAGVGCQQCPSNLRYSLRFRATSGSRVVEFEEALNNSRGWRIVSVNAAERALSGRSFCGTRHQPISTESYPMHSSLIPVGLPTGLVTGYLSYHLCHALGADPAHALSIGRCAGVLASVAAGGVKNVLLGDLLSLLIARPASALASAWGIAAVVANAAT